MKFLSFSQTKGISLLLPEHGRVGQGQHLFFTAHFAKPKRGRGEVFKFRSPDFVQKSSDFIQQTPLFIILKTPLGGVVLNNIKTKVMQKQKLTEDGDSPSVTFALQKFFRYALSRHSPLGSSCRLPGSNLLGSSIY